MKETKNKKPPLNMLVRDGNIWWDQINHKWIKHIPYNIKEEIKTKQPKELGMSNEQFNQLMNQMTSMGKRLDGIDTRLDGIDTRLDGIDTRLDNIDTRLNELRDIVKKNHPDDFTQL